MAMCAAPLWATRGVQSGPVSRKAHCVDVRSSLHTGPEAVRGPERTTVLSMIDPLDVLLHTQEAACACTDPEGIESVSRLRHSESVPRMQVEAAQRPQASALRRWEC